MKQHIGFRQMKKDFNCLLPFLPHKGKGYNLLDPGVKSCPEGLGIFEVADCEEACNNLGIRLSNKRFKRGKPCYKGTSNVCNQNGGFGKNARIICKQEGNVMVKYSIFQLPTISMM